MSCASPPLLCLLILAGWVAAVDQGGPQEVVCRQRQRHLMDDQWFFHRGDEAGAFQADHGERGWQAVTLPHDFSIDSAFDGKLPGANAHLPGGIGWYRRHVTIAAADRDRRVELECEGMYCDAEIWLNGTSVGRQREGYTGTYVDLTAGLRPGQDNVLAIRIANENLPNCRWYSGSGIYRHVWMTITDRLQVQHGGVAITTPSITSAAAQVHVATTVQNHRALPATFTLATVIADDAGHACAQHASTHTLAAGASMEIPQDITVPSPAVWSVETPTLYHAHSQILVDGTLVDDEVRPFGIRSFRFDTATGFLLNGRNLKFKGVCLHHDAGPVGAAVPDAIWASRLRGLKQIGCNAIRLSHNPHAPALLDLCDRMGFLLMDELCDKWGPPYNRFLPEDWQADFRTTVERDRNHPSVIFWSVGNENGEPDAAFVSEGLKRYGGFVRSLDATRPVIAALERGRDKDIATKCRELLHLRSFQDAVLGCNYPEQWYADLRRMDPDLLLLSTESYAYYGSRSDKRDAVIEQNQWLSCLADNHAIGSFVWTGIDYLGEAGTDSIGSGSGLFDLVGARKPAAYLYESFWSERPMVAIAVYEQGRHQPGGLWSWPRIRASWNHPERSRLDLVTYTNCASVDLFVNDTCIGHQALADIPNRIMDWTDVPFEPGTVRAVGRNRRGEEVASFSLRTAGAACAIGLDAERNELHADGRDATVVSCCIQDGQGLRVPGADHLLQLAVTGNGRVIGFGNGDLSAHFATRIPFSERTRQRAFDGRCRAYVQALTTPGPLTVSVTGEGLQPARIIITTR